MSFSCKLHILLLLLWLFLIFLFKFFFPFPAAKWSRPILNISDSYRDTRLEERKVDLNDVKSKLVLRRGSNKPGYLDPKLNTSSAGQRARLPIPNATGYLVRPSSNVKDTDVRRKKNEAFRSLNQTLAAHRSVRKR
ncbi:hypothetical protein HMI56_003024 [Coelomomyces lativittatus]|nr:hypothetical protein HMI56_003024 [Coelomomyces lativittatus]